MSCFLDCSTVLSLLSFRCPLVSLCGFARQTGWFPKEGGDELVVSGLHPTLITVTVTSLKLYQVYSDGSDRLSS